MRLGCQFDGRAYNSASPRWRNTRCADPTSARGPRRRQVNLAEGLHPLAVAAAIDGLNHHAPGAIVAQDKERAVGVLLSDSDVDTLAWCEAAEIAVDPMAEHQAAGQCLGTRVGEMEGNGTVGGCAYCARCEREQYHLRKRSTHNL